MVQSPVLTASLEPKGIAGNGSLVFSFTLRAARSITSSLARQVSNSTRRNHGASMCILKTWFPSWNGPDWLTYDHRRSYFKGECQKMPKICSKKNTKHPSPGVRTPKMHVFQQNGLWFCRPLERHVHWWGSLHSRRQRRIQSLDLWFFSLGTICLAGCQRRRRKCPHSFLMDLSQFIRPCKEEKKQREPTTNIYKCDKNEK